MKNNTGNKKPTVVDINDAHRTEAKTEMKQEVNKMKNNRLSVKTYQKLNRTKNVSFFMHLQTRQLNADAMPLMWIPDIFSYISDDMADIINDLRENGNLSDFEQTKPDDE
ncbi:hypothetical protein CA048_04790 [Salmonella enterica]|nr:hypothetical protein [Salmonella enterica]EBR7328950.1 hypothetical protein [Salmonella enterica]